MTSTKALLISLDYLLQMRESGNADPDIRTRALTKIDCLLEGTPEAILDPDIYEMATDIFNRIDRLIVR